jgi:hypothetical protein
MLNNQQINISPSSMWTLPSKFYDKNFYTSVVSATGAARSTHLILLDIILIIEFVHSVFFSLTLLSHHSVQILSLALYPRHTPTLCSTLRRRYHAPHAYERTDKKYKYLISMTAEDTKSSSDRKFS